MSMMAISRMELWLLTIFPERLVSDAKIGRGTSTAFDRQGVGIERGTSASRDPGQAWHGQALSPIP